MSDAPSLLSTTREQEEGKEKKNTPQSYIYTYMYHNVITIKHHVYYYATLPTFSSPTKTTSRIIRQERAS